MVTRICIDCGEDKELKDLVPNKKCLHGHRKLCRSCNVLRVKARTNKTSKALYDKKRRAEKLEDLRAYDRVRSSLPHRKAAKAEHTRRRKALIRNAVPDERDKEGIKAMYVLAQKLTKLTGIQMHVDHIHPLSKGGMHDVKNLQLLAAPLNLRKGSKTHFQLPWKDYPAEESF